MGHAEFDFRMIGEIRFSEFGISEARGPNVEISLAPFEGSLAPVPAGSADQENFSGMKFAS